MMKEFTTKACAAVFLLLVLLWQAVQSEAKSCHHRRYGKGSKRRECKPETTPAPSPAPSQVPTSPPTQEDVKITFANETIKFLNVANVSGVDIDSLFVVQKEWLENYFMEQGRRRMQRRRDSRDITTEFEFVAQNVTNSTEGKPTNEVTYNQVIGFLPSRRRLVEIDIEDVDEVYQVSTSIYRDMEALDSLAGSLRDNIDSFASLESIVKFAPPRLTCGNLCQQIRAAPIDIATSGNSSSDPNTR